MSTAQLSDVASVRRFVLAGAATFTLVSRATGARFTYRVRSCENNDALWFVSVLTGQDNENSYSYLGIIRDSTLGYRFQRTAKSRLSADSPSCKAADWFFRAVFAVVPILPASVEFWHEGRCCRCGRKLTVPESIAAGVGPECASKGSFVAFAA